MFTKGGVGGVPPLEKFSEKNLEKIKKIFFYLKLEVFQIC
jgi:hypothetical protein